MKRLFLYVVAFVSLVFAAVGIAQLLTVAIDNLVRRDVLVDDQTTLAVALAFTIVGIPAWGVSAFLARRVAQRHPVERRSLARRTYLLLVRATALVIVMVQAVAAGRMLVGLDDFEGGPVGWLIAWAAVWAVHHWIASAEPAGSRATRLVDRLYLYFAAVAGLYTLGAGLILTANRALSAAYDATVLEPLVLAPWTEGLRSGAVTAVVGAVVWGGHWLRSSRRDAGTTLWQVYIFLFGILAGLTTAIGAAAVLLHTVLEWFLGVPASDTAAAHFDVLPRAVAALAVGVGFWAYHRAVLAESGMSEAARGNPERVYRYLVAAAGLLMTAGGLATLFALAIEVVVAVRPALVVDEGWWRNQLVTAITFLIVGAPLWVRYWFQAQRFAAIGGAVERAALPRRIFIFGVFGLASLAVLTNLVILLYQFFDAALEGDLSREVVHDTRWSIALLLTAGAVAGYYWLVLREDGRALDEVTAAAEPAVARGPREVVLIAPGAPGVPGALAESLERALGTRVRAWRRLDANGAAPEVTSADLERLRAAILATPGDRVAVIVDAAGAFEVIPYASN